jgi:hypothetical protein
MPIKSRKQDKPPKILSPEEQEAALVEARKDKAEEAKPEKRKIYRHTIDVPADLNKLINEELKRTRLTKRNFWLMLAEEYFNKK